MASQAMETIGSLIKALEAGNYDVQPSKLVQGPALTVEDLSSSVEVTTFDDSHIKLQKSIKVESCKSTLAQFDRQLSYGIFGGSAQLEGHVGQEETSDYVRITFPMCFYSHTRKVTLPSMLVQTVDGKKSDERAAADAAKKLAGDIEFDLFRGKADFSNAGVFDGNMGAIALLPNLLGVDAQIRQSDLMRNAQDLMFNEYGSDESVVLAGGSTLTQENIEDGWTRSQMNHGNANRLVVDPKVMSNYNKISYAKERIVLAGSPQDVTGSDLTRQFVSGGIVKVEASRFLSGKTGPAPSRSNGPAIPTITSSNPAAISGVTTGFLNGQVYLYSVTACNEVGESPRSASSTATIDADGKGVQVVISHSGLSNIRFFSVYRSAAGGSVMKYIGRVAIALGASSTTFTDLGNKQPGFVTGFLLEDDSMMIKELSPFSRLKLAVTQLAQPEAFFRFLSFGMLAPRKNVLIDNLR
jgi:hypothetical protein